MSHDRIDSYYYYVCVLKMFSSLPHILRSQKNPGSVKKAEYYSVL